MKSMQHINRSNKISTHELLFSNELIASAAAAVANYTLCRAALVASFGYQLMTHDYHRYALS